MQTNFVEELRWRGLLQDLIPETEAFLLSTSTRGYIGLILPQFPSHRQFSTNNYLMHFQKADTTP